jgi:dTDP-4-amino-4,6-dideoxygalactose transaminase
MTAVMRIAEKHNLIVIEDCAQAVGARYRGRTVGTFGAASFFSFQLLKASTHTAAAWRSQATSTCRPIRASRKRAFANFR